MKDKLFKYLVMAFCSVILLFGFSSCSGGNGCNGCGGVKDNDISSSEEISESNNDSESNVDSESNNDSESNDNSESGDEDSSHEHVYSQVADSKYLIEEATCEKQAVYSESCSCGAVSDKMFTAGELKEHEMAQLNFFIDGVYYETESCSHCKGNTQIKLDGVIVNDFHINNTGELHPHNYKLTEWAKEATCTRKGVVACFECQDCNAKVVKETPALGHAYDEIEIIEQATCTKQGSWGATCTRCGEAWTGILTASHRYGAGRIIVEPDCEEKGLIKYTCKLCSDEKQEQMEPLGHDWGKWEELTSATCTEEGERRHTCTRCFKEETETFLAQHSWGGGKVVSVATCTQNGEVKYTCQTCGETKTDITPAGHSWGVSVVEEKPTCLEAGKSVVTCTRCGETKIITLEALGHSYKVLLNESPTCEEWGCKISQCVYCGDVIESKLPPTLHELIYLYDEEQHWHSCTKCDDVNEQKTNHTLAYRKDYEAISDGEKITYVHTLYLACNVCDYAQWIGESVSHTHSAADIIEGKLPTCIEDGYTPSLVCAVAGCKDVLVPAETLSALGHNYVDGVCTRCGEVEGSKGLEYTLSADKTYYIVSDIGTCKDTKVVIPAKHQGLPVKEIGASAFDNFHDITKVIIPDSVTSIGEYAFYGCSSLTEVIIPDSVTSIGDFGLYYCNSLTEIIVDEGNECYSSSDGDLYNKDQTTLIQYAIGKTATSFTIPDSVTSIELYAFSWCSSLREIVIPDSVTSIGQDAFTRCSSLTDIVIPDSVTSIGYGVFSGCSSLTEIVIPDSVTSIGGNAFYECSSLTEIVIPDSVTSIGSGAFYGCRSLTEIVIPDSVTSIGRSPFYGTGYYYDKNNWNGDELYIGKYLIEVQDDIAGKYTIKDGTKCIASYTFSGCRSLTEIVIPSSVTNISDYAFAFCYSLTEIVIPTSVTNISNSAFYWCSSLTKVVIPDSVTSIGDSAFQNCSSLTEIVIPNSVTSIGNSAFTLCKNLTSIIFEGTVEEWEEITKQHYWNNDIPATEVVCKNGVVTL